MTDDHQMFSADLPRSWLATPPGNEPVASVRDVLLVTGDPNVHSPPDAYDLYPPILMPSHPDGPWGPAVPPEPIDVGQEVSLFELEREQANRVMNACSPRGHYFSPVRQYGQRYTFIKTVPSEDWEQHLYRWDTDVVLRDLLAISRLVLDHGFSTEFGARIVDRANGEQTVMWTQAQRPVYRLRHTRDWFTQQEVDQLTQLLAAFRLRKDALPAAVRRALWNLDYGVHIEWLDIRLPLLVIAFEGLVSTSSARVSKQFRERVPAVTSEAGFSGITPELCNDVYDARSRWAHGSHIALKSATRGAADPDGEQTEQRDAIDLVLMFQQALRAIVRKCIMEPDFAAVFADKTMVAARWPVEVRDG